MKSKLSFTMLFLLLLQAAFACPVCEKQQPEITQGITHGAGPQSNWDWAIIAVIIAVTIVTLFYTVKYLTRPKEKNTNHIKYLILNNTYDERG